MKKFYEQYLQMSEEQRGAFDFTIKLSAVSASIIAALFALVGLFV